MTEELAGRPVCAPDAHLWALAGAEWQPDWYDGAVYRCSVCRRIAYTCLAGPVGDIYEDPVHDPTYTAIGHEWVLAPEPDAPCASRRAECPRCHLAHQRWSDVQHDWVNDNPNPSIEDPEWAMAFGLVEWVGTRRCARCGISEYSSPSW